MKVFKTDDGTVSKYIHDDGSETTIKMNGSCNNALETNRDKFSVFLSSSVGCPLGCKFCYLTLGKRPYKKLDTDTIINNAKEAIEAKVKENPWLRKKYVKLSWMGMGDAFLLNPVSFRDINERLVDWLLRDTGYAWGLDGIDISTVLPKGEKGWPHQLANLNDLCNSKYRLNPTNINKSPVRLFYSLHTPENRQELIPSSVYGDSFSDLEYLNGVSEWYGIDLILHHMLLEGVNDDEESLAVVKDIVLHYTDQTELRVLRYNQHPLSTYRESTKFESIVKGLKESLPKFKYQVSDGAEILGACGQFYGE